MAPGGFLGRFFEIPPVSKGAVCLAPAQDKDRRAVKGEPFGKVPHAGGPGLFPACGSLGGRRPWGSRAQGTLSAAVTSFLPFRLDSTRKPSHLFQQPQMPLKLINNN